MRARISIVVGLVALLAGPAWAQQKPMQRYGEKDKDKSFTEQQAEKDAERAYQRSLGNVPEKGPADPWGQARSAEAPKPAKGEAKTVTAKPKAKAGGAPN